MKRVFFLLLVLVILAGSAYAFLRLRLGDTLHNRQALETLFYERLDRLLATRSKGESRILRILGEKLGRCSFESQTVPFPFSLQVLLSNKMHGPYGEASGALRSVICKIPPDNSPISFTSNKEGVVRFLRQPGRPVVLELRNGVVSVVADKLYLQIRLPHAYLIFKSQNPAQFDIWRANEDAYGLLVRQGDVSLEQEPIVGYVGVVPVVRLRAENPASLTVAGELLKNTGNSVLLLPSGIR